MSLAHKGELADRMFTFDQKGTKSLCADWNQTFYMDRLLSDVHFLVGDVSLSESFAMDGFTQAKRKGSARMMQRFVQVCLIRGEWRWPRNIWTCLPLCHSIKIGLAVMLPIWYIRN